MSAGNRSSRWTGAADAETSLDTPVPYDLTGTLRHVALGSDDPGTAFADGRAAIALHTPEGPVTMGAVQDGRHLRIRAWGAGADWAVARSAGLFGLEDDPSGFEPKNQTLRELHRRFEGLRLPRLPVITGRLTRIVLEQLVTYIEARRAWHNLLRAHGADAPGPLGLRLPPDGPTLARLSVEELLLTGATHRQARTLIAIGRETSRLERAAGRDPDELSKRLRAIAGIGPWTVACLRGSALGDADAVVLGDYGLPSALAWLMVRQPRADDAWMVEALAPYAGHRYRVVRLLHASGIKPPRRGPGRPVRPLPRL